MEQNLFFAHMLRGLGFTVYSVGARVRRREHGVPIGDYIG
jgi:arylamine N-acetyltransferase